MTQGVNTNRSSGNALVVKVLRSTSHRSRFWWIVRNDRDGQIVESSFQTYPNEEPLAVQGKSRCELYAGDLGKFGRLTFVRLPPNKYGDFRVSDREY